MPKRSEANRKTNIGVARAVPVLMLGLMGYTSWVITRVICVDYLLSPPASSPRGVQRGGAIAVLVTYYIALTVLLVTYGRLLETVTRRPGLIPRGPQWHVERSRQKQAQKSGRQKGRSSSTSEDEKSTETEFQEMPKEIQYLANESLPFRVEDFWLRDVFECKPDGRPRYCETCYNWKPDRSHHCSEMNRCILKFDHFCPWVAGVVSETSYKFFIQFNFYGALYTLQVLVTTAYFFAQRRQDTGYLNGHYIAMLALSGLFFVFSAGMCMSAAQFAFINSTTIENIDRKTVIWTLAVYANRHVVQEIEEKGLPLHMISYPRPPEESLSNAAQAAAGTESNQRAGEQRSSHGPTTSGHRTFVILKTAPGVNPFDLGPLENFQDIMGPTLWQWLLPVKPSPCLKHDSPISLYKLGAAVEELKASSGITTWDTEVAKKRRRKSKTRNENGRQEG